MRKRILWAVAFGIVLGLAGCVETQPEEKPAGANTPPVVKDVTLDPFRDRLLQIAGEYKSYGQADQTLRLGWVYCWAPQRDIPNLRLSASGDSTTHGRKFYFMYAKQVWDSRSQGWIPGSYTCFPGKTAPVGQVIVKQSWVPEVVTEGASPSDEEQLAKGLPLGIVKRDGKSYRAARQGELFVMFKVDPATPESDNGWVYGTVSADAKSVLSVGRIESCMSCHQKAPHDRLFGLPEEHAKPPEPRVMTWPKDWSEQLGQSVTVEGMALNAKLGALLGGDGGPIWIDGRDEWPNGFYSGGNKGKRVRVTGVVIKRDDMPVFLQTGGVIPQGIPVNSEEELQKGKRRFLLRDAKWTLLE